MLWVGSFTKFYNMSNWSTDANPTGRVINGTKLANIQNYISRTAGVFGLTVVATETPTKLNPVNVDEVRIMLENLVKGAKMGNRGDAIVKYVKLANSVGVELSIGPSFVSVVAGLAVTGLAQTAGNADWTEYIPVDAGVVTYDLELYNTDTNPDVLVTTHTDVSFATLVLALNTLTNYKIRIRGQWPGGSTPWSGFITFASTNATAPAGLAVGTIATTTAVASWTAKVIQAYSVTYDISIHLASNDSVVVSSLNQAGITFNITGLTASTNYYAKVRAKWTADAAVKNTAYSANVAFTTTA